MINDLQKIVTRLQNFQDSLIDFIKDELMENEELIVTMNSDEQLFEEGINRVGVSISDYMPYTIKTLAIKTIKGQPTDRVTLRDTGDFESSFWVEFGTDKFEIKASDFKTEKLIVKYGKQIMGLTDDNLDYIISAKIKSRLMTEIRK